MSHPINSTFDRRLQKWFGFDVPDNDDFFHVDINDRRYRQLVLAALSYISRNIGAGACSQDGGIPVNVQLPVTDTGVILANLAVKSRKVGIWNNGESDIIILEGATLPGFAGQDNGDGVLTVDFGLILEPGEYFESPVAHNGLIQGRSRDTESSMTTVTLY